MEITYKKGNRVTIKDGSSTKMATVVADGLDSQKRVRVRVDGFPMDMSITTNQSSNVYVIEKMAKGSTVKGGKFNLEEFNDWWFDGGEETADEEYGELVTKALLKKQPSYPNEANAYSEALWELAKKDNAHKKYAKGSTVKGNKWSEVKSDFTDEDGTVFIDAYLTEDDNEEGKVIAKVKPNGSVEYLDNSAKSDAYAQEIIKEVVADMKGTKYAKGSTLKGKDFSGNYYSTNDFVGAHNLQKQAEKILGKGWEAEDDVNQIESIINSLGGKYVVTVPEDRSQWNEMREQYDLAKPTNDSNYDIFVISESDFKYGNGGGVAVSSESGLAVGTNADLMMNQNNLQYADGGGVGEKKYLFVSYNVTVNEDSFEEGESIEVFSEYDEKVGKVYNSMENLLKDMNRIMGTEYSKDDFDFETGEGRNIQTDVLVDEDFIPPYANEVEKWKKGELKLYNAHYSFYVMPIYVADQYANGGNMSMGFNYEIGGL